MPDDDNKPTPQPCPPQAEPAVKPAKPTRPPNPNVVPPSPVQIQEGFDPVREKKKR